jgi:hypothetical protein
MFQNEEYPPDDEDIDKYKNIGKHGIHTMVAHPMLFPYNDVVQWCFTHLQKETTIIVNTSSVPIATMKIEDIRSRYKTP